MQAIPTQAWQAMPEDAQQEVYDFFIFIEQRYSSKRSQDHNETVAFSNHSASLIEDWNSEEEDDVWT